METELEQLKRNHTMSEWAAFQYFLKKRELEDRKELPYIDPADEPHIELGYN